MQCALRLEKCKSSGCETQSSKVETLGQVQLELRQNLWWKQVMHYLDTRRILHRSG